MTATSRLPAPVQEAMWVADQLAGSPLAHNTGVAIRLPAPLDSDILQAAADLVSAQHAMLRTCCAFDDDFMLVLRDNGHGPAVDTGPGCTAPPAVRLDHEPAWWIGLAQLPEPMLVAVFHHALIDPWSLNLTLDEIRIAYHDLDAGRQVRLPTPAGDYSDYVALMRDRDRHPDQQSVEYWQQQLDSVAPLPETLSEMLRSHPQTYGGSLRIDLTQLRPAARAAARAHHATLFAVLLAACGHAVAQFADSDLVLVAMPVVNREIPDSDRTVGCFTDMSLIPVAGAAADLNTLIEPTFLAIAEAIDNQLPYQTILARCAPERHGGRPIQYDLCSVTLYPEPFQTTDGWSAEPFDVQAVSHALQFGFEDGEHSLKLVLHYGRGINHDDASVIVGNLVTLLRTLTPAPQ